MRNAHIQREVMELIDSLTMRKYRSWCRHATGDAVVSTFLESMVREHGIDFELGRDRVADTDIIILKRARKGLRIFANDVVHLPLFKNLANFVVKIDEQGSVSHPYETLIKIICNNSSFKKDRSGFGLGDEMPYSLGVTFRYSSNFDWLEITLLCDDFRIYDDDFALHDTAQDDSDVILFFKDEEDYLEALLLVNR